MKLENDATISTAAITLCHEQPVTARGAAPAPDPREGVFGVELPYASKYVTVRNHQMHYVDQGVVFMEAIVPPAFPMADLIALTRRMSEAEKEAYRAPFKDPQTRFPIYVWPNELPIAGQPARVELTKNNVVRQLTPPYSQAGWFFVAAGLSDYLFDSLCLFGSRPNTQSERLRCQ